MEILHAHIDKFGILAEQKIEGLSSGLNVFWGNNEAGKSTTLQFFQAMFFGYKRGKQNLDSMLAKKAMQAGGTLQLCTQEKQLFTLTRRPQEKKGGIVFMSGAGDILQEQDLHRLLGNITVGVFDNVFAFNLKSLMDVGSLNGDEVRNSLHGAAFGMGMQSPHSILKMLDARSSELLKMDRVGVSAVINSLVGELDEVDGQLELRVPDLERYGQIEQQLLVGESETEALQKRKEILQQQVQYWDQCQNLWPLWQKLELLQGQLAMMQEEPVLNEQGESAYKKRQFAPDALARLDALHERKYELTERLAGVQSQVKLVEQEMADLAPICALAELETPIKRLQEQKEARAGDVEAISSFEFKLEHLQSAQEERLVRLGKSWSFDSALQADISLQSVDAIARFTDALQQKTLLVTQEQDNVRRLQQEKQSIEDALSMMQSTQTGDVFELPNQKDVDELAGVLGQARIAANQWNIAVAAVEKGQSSCAAAVAEVHSEWSVERLLQIDMSSAVRAKGHHISRSLRDNALQCQQVEEQIQQHEQLAVQYQSNLAAILEALSCETSAQWSDVIVARNQYLREVEALLMRWNDISQQYTFLESQAATQEPQASGGFRSILWVVLGGLVGMLVVGGLLGGFGWWNGQMWLSALGGVLSVVAFGGLAAVYSKGLLTQKVVAQPATLFYEQQKERVSNDLLTIQEQLQQVVAQLHKWDASIAVKGSDIAMLPAMVQAAWVYVKDCQTKEQELARLSVLHQQEKAALEQLMAHSQKLCQQKIELEQDWRMLVEQARFKRELEPENFDAFVFAVDRAHVRLQEMQQGQDAVWALVQAVGRCLQKMVDLPFCVMQLTASQQAYAQQWKNVWSAIWKEKFLPVDYLQEQEQVVSSLLAHTGDILFLLRQKQQQQQEDATQQRILHERQEQLARVVHRTEQAEQMLAQAHAEYATCRQNWHAWLIQYGFGAAIEPETAKEAVGILQDLQENEKVRLTLEQEKQACLVRLQEYLQTIVVVCQACGVPVSTTDAFMEATSFEGAESGLPREASELRAAYAPLEKLLDEAAGKVFFAVKTQMRVESLRERCDELKEARQNALAALEVATKLWSELLQEAEVASAEEFRRLFAMWQQEQELIGQKQELLASFYALARKENKTIEDILQIFAHTSYETLVAEHAIVSNELAEIELSLTALAEVRGTLWQEQKGLLSGADGKVLWQRKAVLEESLHEAMLHWCRVALAKQLLQEAKTRFEQEGQMGVLGTAGQFFNFITGGEYTGITAADGDVFFAVHNSGGQRNPEKQLSQGTREQLYLALRLAYIQYHASKAEPVPVFMDDILVNFDRQRAAKTAEMLVKFACTNQLLFFTCHERTRDLLAEVGGSGNGSGMGLYLIEKGMIIKSH